MTRKIAAALVAAMLGGCQANLLPDNVANWHEGCDYTQLAGKSAIVTWANNRAEVDAACRGTSQFPGMQLATFLGCTLTKPAAPLPGFDNDLWQSIDGVIITTPEAWVALHESCHLGLGPESRNHPPHDSRRGEAR